MAYPLARPKPAPLLLALAISEGGLLFWALAALSSLAIHAILPSLSTRPAFRALATLSFAVSRCWCIVAPATLSPHTRTRPQDGSGLAPPCLLWPGGHSLACLHIWRQRHTSRAVATWHTGPVAHIAGRCRSEARPHVAAAKRGHTSSNTHARIRLVRIHKSIGPHEWIPFA